MKPLTLAKTSLPFLRDYVNESARLLFGGLCLLLFSMNIWASSAEISGKVTDATTGEALFNATIQVFQNDQYISGTTTDFDGFYTVKPLATGVYKVEVRYLGKQTQVIENIRVSVDQLVTLDVLLESTGLEIPEFVITTHRTPLLEPGKIPTQVTIDSKMIDKLPTRDLNTMIGMAGAGIYQADRNGGFNVRGARMGSTLILIDGVKSETTAGIPAGAIDQMEVITGGIPAKYGDTTGGVIIINTKSYTNQ
ncbi:MAG: carboxypeptidase regulatory-like domain-containing protein [Chitinophagales bacterium]